MKKAKPVASRSGQRRQQRGIKRLGLLKLHQGT